MVLSPTLEALLAQLPPADRLEFAGLLQAIEQVRFTGPLTIDFLNGVPRQINLGQPLKLTICHGERLPAAPGGVDKPGRPRTP